MEGTHLQPRMRIDIKTLQEVDTHKNNRDSMGETNTDSEEKVIFMQYIRSFLFIFGLDKLCNLKDVYNDFKQTSLRVKFSPDIKQEDEKALRQ